MDRLLSRAAVVGLLVASSSSVFAGGHGGSNASNVSPGQQFRTEGPVTSGPTAGPGASGYSPDQQFRANGAGTTSPDASVYAPGFLK